MKETLIQNLISDMRKELQHTLQLIERPAREVDLGANTLVELLVVGAVRGGGNDSVGVDLERFSRSVTSSIEEIDGVRIVELRRAGLGTGLVDDELFLLMVGIGFDGAVIRGVNPALKRRFGKGGVIWSGLKVWWHGPGADIRLVVDGREKRAQWAVVLNGRYFAGPYVLSRKGNFAMPGLTLFLFQKGSRFALVRYLIALGLGRVERLSDVEVLSARRIEVQENAAVCVEIDGDDRGHLPLVIEQGRQMLRLVVPQDWKR